MADSATHKRGHRRFARNYDRVMADFEQRFGARYRGRLLEEVSGGVLEVGVGTGSNFPYYCPDQISRLVGIEPDAFMLEQARLKSVESGLNVTLFQADMQQLPFATSSFDAVVMTLVLCSVAQPQLALAELRRVLKPDGKLYFFEHVGSPNLIGRAVQLGLNPLWSLAAGGCRLNRDTAGWLEQTGFKFERLERLRLLPLSPINPQIWGVATAPGTI